MTVAGVDWIESRQALAANVARVTALLRADLDPGLPALAQWDVADVATHLAQAWDLVPRLASGTAASPLNDVWELSAATTSLVSDETERNLEVLADRIDACGGEFLATLDGADPAEPGPWLVRGVEMPLQLFVCHLLNESIVHGFDMARASGRPWPIEAEHAALALLGFVFPAVDALGQDLVDQRAAAGLTATFDIRLRGGSGRVFFIFDDGTLRVEAPSSRRVDCHLSADPAAFLLVVWARTSQWSAIARGQITAWGRRPWLGPRLRTLMRNT